MTCNTQIKRLNALWINTEDTAGTMKDPVMFIPFSKASLKPEIEISKNTMAYWNIVENYENTPSKSYSILDIEGDVLDVSFWYLSYWALSQYTHTDDWNWNHTHSFEIQNDNCNKTLSAYEVSKTWNKQTTYNMLDSLSINIVSWDTIKYKASLKWKSITDADNVVNVVYNDKEKSFVSNSVIIKMGTDLTDAENQTPTSVKEFNVNINKNAKEIEGTRVDWSDSIDVLGFNNLQTTINGDLTKLFEDEVYRDKVLNWEVNAMIIEAKWRDLASWEKAKLKIYINKASFESWSSSDDLNGLIEETLGFDVAYDSNTGSTIKIELINDYDLDY